MMDNSNADAEIATLPGGAGEDEHHLEKLNHSITFMSAAVGTMPQDYPGRAAILSHLASLLGMRLERTESMDDLNRLVEVTSMAADTTPRDDMQEDRASWLSDLGVWLGKRFERTGSMDDLNQAVDAAGTAVDITPQGHPSRASYFSNLGNLLGIRFEWIGSIDDLNRAVDAAGTAVDITPHDHQDRASWSSNLGILLDKRFERTRSIDDLNRAVDVSSTAVDISPEDHFHRAGWLANLGNRLGSRFKETKVVDDLNRAVDLTSKAVEITPKGHPDQANRLNNLANLLGWQFDLNGSIDNLNRAINVAKMAVNSISEDHLDRGIWLENLAILLRRRFKQSELMEDLDLALLAYKEGWHYHTTAPSTRIRLARAAVDILAFQQNWEESSQLLQEAVYLLPTVSPRLLEHTDKQHILAGFAGLASEAAALALEAGKDAYHALRLLELGRGVIAGLLMDMRGDISDLKQKHASLADEFISLRDELDSPGDTYSMRSDGKADSWESQAKRRREADKNFSELITKIRHQPGFENFLLPPSEDELRAEAVDPIVVVNLSSYRSDAFIVERERIRVVELTGLTLHEVQKRADNVRQRGVVDVALLEWLWTAICEPCLNALQFRDPVMDDGWPRVWWIPTGPLSQLPFHAAGRNTEGSTETVLDRVMSSYASSIKSLLHGRRREVRDRTGTLTDSAVLIAMSATPGMLDKPNGGRLPYAVDEVKMVTDLCLSLKLQPVTPVPCKDDVLRHLHGCRIFHFAGHGKVDLAEPSRSCLLLDDWKSSPFTVGDLRDSRLQENRPFFAYLSACSTSANSVVGLADESIHLVSAFQLAGFRHVVGTLWEVSDRHCVDVARNVYETMRDEGMTDKAVCRGLHRALKRLRDEQRQKDESRDAKLQLAAGGAQARGMRNPYWVPYVHYGV